MAIYEFEGVRPVVDPTAFVHPDASVIGDVIIGRGCFVGPGASLRGDIGRIILREGSNVQDNCTVHIFPGREVVVEENGHIGHGAVLHGCTIRRNALVGMNAVVMDDAVVGEDSFIGAMSFVTSETVVPARTLFAGIPAKAIRDLTDDEVAWKTRGTVVYQELARRYLKTFRPCEALTSVEANRPELPAIVFDLKHRLHKV